MFYTDVRVRIKFSELHCEKLFEKKLFFFPYVRRRVSIVRASAICYIFSNPFTVIRIY